MDVISAPDVVVWQASRKLVPMADAEAAAEKGENDATDEGQIRVPHARGP